MKNLIIIIVAVGILTGCSYHPKEKRLTEFKNNDNIIVKSFYRKKSDTIEFKRILTRDSKFLVQSGQIFLGEYALTHQKLKGIQQFTDDDKIIDSLSMIFINEGFASELLKERLVMFIQIVPDSTMGTVDNLRFLNLRQDIEGQIDNRLKIQNLGEWFAGDMGAGANMLFFIDDWDKATEVVVEILKQNDLIDHVLIVKRITTAIDNWNYEVVYPVEYEGVFNQM